jgi:Fe-S-cluster containining protein
MTINTLNRLHSDIDDRVKTIIEDNLDWPCRMGCDGCCRRLAEIPRLTIAEWDLLREGLDLLPPEQLQGIVRDVAELSDRSSRPIICPMLDQSAGSCMVYAYRPVACRTYGFYVQRDKGLYCKDIETRVANGDWSGVVWGNQDPVDRRLGGLGDARDLTEWFAYFNP